MPKQNRIRLWGVFTQPENVVGVEWLNQRNMNQLHWNYIFIFKVDPKWVWVDTKIFYVLCKFFVYLCYSKNINVNTSDLWNLPPIRGIPIIFKHGTRQLYVSTYVHINNENIVAPPTFLIIERVSIIYHREKGGMYKQSVKDKSNEIYFIHNHIPCCLVNASSCAPFTVGQKVFYAKM